MNIKKIIFGLGAAALMLSSCSRDNEATPAPNSSSPDAINTFVWNAMNSWYYWQPNVPNLADSFKNTPAYNTLLSSKTPDKLFYSLLYNYGTTDRFSWIENNNVVINAGKSVEVEPTSGLHYALYPKDNNGTIYVALVNYVTPGTPAEAAGLKRGDVITRVNGSPLTSSNYSQLGDKQFTVTRAATVTLTSTALVTTDRAENITLTTINKDENPVAFYKKYVYGAKNVGYLVFNGFKADYNDELNAAFAQMKSDGINELILDLRYNGGGSLETAVALAQMINGNFTGSPYVYLNFNNKHSKENGWENLKNTVQTYNLVNNHPEVSGQQNINSLSLPKIYVLVSFQTASASELTISSLGKYINITTIGDETVGKYVGSITLYDSPASDYTSYANRNLSHNWQLQPITFAYFNRDKDPVPTDGSGIKPTVALNPYQNFNNIKDFGVTSDPALKKALEMITGQTINRAAESQDLIDISYRKNVMSMNRTDPTKGLYIQDFEKFKKEK